MGCFEIRKPFVSSIIFPQINFNMGCFEITAAAFAHFVVFTINFNMGCFEMTVGEIVLRTGTGLTLTWDVLKFYEVYRGYN